MNCFALLLLAAAPSIAAEIDFDKGRLDVPGIVAELKAKSGELATPEAPELPPAPKEGKVKVFGNVEVYEYTAEERAKHATLLQPNMVCHRADRDCVGFLFEPQDSESEAVYLRSTEYREDCRYDHQGRRECWCAPSYSYRARAQIKITPREPLLAWEREKFVMCLEDRWLTYDEVAVAYDYDAKFIQGTGTVQATPKRKIAMNPDADGIKLAGFELDGGNFKVTATDKWSREYLTAGGETTVLRIKLKRDAFLTDPTIADVTVQSAPQDRYEVRLADHAGAFKDKLEGGKKYYVELSFQRIGRLSKDKSVDAGESGKIELPKSLSAGSAR